MLHLILISASGVRETICPNNAFVLTPQNLSCEGDAKPIAEFRRGMWWRGNEPYTSGEFLTNALLRFRDGPTLGPYERVRVAGEYLYGDETLVASARAGQWRLRADRRRYDAVVVVPAA